MKSRFRLIFFALSIILVSRTTVLFSQISMRELGDVLSEFATDNGNRLPITADTGLNWSDGYIGQLIDIPPHYGFGITIGMNTLKTDKLDAYTDKLGIKKLDPWFANKQFFPLYVLETRIGGFRDSPFDIGFKVGYLPAAFDLFGTLQYENLIFGGDIRWAVLKGYGLEPMISLGGGVNYLSGFFLQRAYEGHWTGTSSGFDVDTAGSDLRLTWDVISFLLKFSVSKSLFWDRITLFLGVNGGFSIANTGLGILGDQFLYGDPNNLQPLANLAQGVYDSVATTLKSDFGNDTSWELSDKFGQFGAWGTITTYPITLYVYGGLAFDFDNDTHLQLQLVMDISNLEYGFSLGWRWQQ